MNEEYRYVNLNNAIDAIYDSHGRSLDYASNDVPSGIYYEYDDVVYTLEHMPTVEIVRCKDCLHWKDSVVVGHRCDIHNWISSEDDFCSRAEVKEDD